LNVIVDTNVLGELTRRRPDRGVLEWAAAVDEIGVSVVTVEEIAYGLARKPNARIEAWFRTFLRDSCVILPVTAEIAEQAGRIRGRLAAAGRSRTQADMLIASTALAHGLTLVTRNTRDFEGVSVSILNPFRR